MTNDEEQWKHLKFMATRGEDTLDAKAAKWAVLTIKTLETHLKASLDMTRRCLEFKELT